MPRTATNNQDYWLKQAARYAGYASHFVPGTATHSKWLAKADEARREAAKHAAA